MQRYLEQLLGDIANAIENEKTRNANNQVELYDWISEEEEERTAPIRNLQELTGIQKEMLPPVELLTDEQVKLLLQPLIQLLDTLNCCFVLQQSNVPERLQYSTIQYNFDQDIKLKEWHMGFFSLCKPGTEHKQCTLKEYCQCAFYAELFADCIDENLTPEEQRARDLEIEIEYLKKRYEDDWFKYYPYHLDKNYDDEYGNPYNYGMDEDEEEDSW